MDSLLKYVQRWKLNWTSLYHNPLQRGKMFCFVSLCNQIFFLLLKHLFSSLCVVFYLEDKEMRGVSKSLDIQVITTLEIWFTLTLPLNSTPSILFLEQRQTVLDLYDVNVDVDVDVDLCDTVMLVNSQKRQVPGPIFDTNVWFITWLVMWWCGGLNRKCLSFFPSLGDVDSFFSITIIQNILNIHICNEMLLLNLMKAKEKKILFIISET